MTSNVASRVRKTRVVVLAAAAWVVACAFSIHASPKPNRSIASGETEQTSTPSIASDAMLIQKYCATCHSEKRKTGGLVLEGVNVEQPGANAELWERVLRKLHTGAMPPPGMPRPDGETVRAFVSRLEREIDGASLANPNPGRPAIHRLNRFEYTNVIRDLLAVNIDGKALLPADDSGYGFDNIADVLSFSPGLLERYMIAAQKVSAVAIGDGRLRRTVETVSFPSTLVQDSRLSNDLPAGSRGVAIHHFFPADGQYAFTVHLQKERLGSIRGLAESQQLDLRVDGERAHLFTIEKTTNKDKGRALDEADPGDAGLNVRIPVKAGPRVITLTFPQNTWLAEGVGPSHLPISSTSFAQGIDTDTQFGRIEAGIDSVDIEGPFEGKRAIETPSRQRIFVCYPAEARDETGCARKVLGQLARRAYRRPATAADLETLLRVFKEGRQESGTFDGGVRSALDLILTDPEFLFRVEREPAAGAPGTPYAVSDIDLASRLSFFIWSSIPDDQLLELAARGRLSQPAELESQVKRMLADPRSDALVQSFFGQWLSVRSVSSVMPDPRAFPDFDENLRDAFEQETSLFLRSQVLEDRPLTELLTANYTFLNERLARHYGIANVYGGHFRRVILPDDRRAGILGQGSVLTVTSYANRTSPVVRGKWLLETLLGAPPPPPPPDVPPFPENKPGAAPTTVRERMEEHRKSPACATCHARLDPIGFAMENFDGIGEWRGQEAGHPIDPSGAFPDGTTFNGPAGFRAALLDRYKDAFVTTATERLLTYALGRGVGYYDMPAIRTIDREAAKDDYRWSALVTSIVTSTPFRMRRLGS